jgi:hypothetical protein
LLAIRDEFLSSGDKRREARDSCDQLVVSGALLTAALALFGYLDPGSGSMLVQLLVGGVAAAAVALKLYWYRLLRLLRIRRDEPELQPLEPDRDR